MTDITYTAEQAAIIHDPDLSRDSLIVAGAGSGKTFTMTQRIIELISQGVPANSVLGLTFSRKAAAELGSRVGQAVDEQRRLTAQASSDKAFLQPEVSTYDAFFQQIVRQYGLLIGVSQGMTPLSAAGCFELAGQVVADSAAEIFAAFGADEGSGPAGEGLSAEAAETAGSGTATGGGSAGRFDALVQDVIALSNECLSFMIDADCRTVAAAVARAQAWNDAFLKRLSDLLEEERRQDPDCYQETAERKAPKSVREYKPDEKDSVRLTRERNSHQQALFRVMRLRDTAKRRQVLLDLVLKYDALKKASGFAEYADFTAYAFDLLTRFPSIGEQYRRRFSHVFLDEYQDTSTTQAKLIALLFHSGRPSTVTAVGDPFQAIYGFRGASPGAFALFCRDFSVEGSAIRSLTRTMRNRPLVLAVANSLTRVLRQPEYLWRSTGRPTTAVEEVAVQPLRTLVDNDQGEDRSTTGVPAMGEPAEGEPTEGASTTSEPTEGTPAIGEPVTGVPAADSVVPAQAVAAPVEATFAAMGYSSVIQQAEAVARFALYECQKNAAAPKPAVAVLFRSRGAIEDYRKVLEGHGLRVQAVGTSVLMAQPEIRDLFALLEAVSDHSDSEALLRLLASARFGLSARALGDLANWAADLNAQRQYAALVAAGLARGDEDPDRRKDLLCQHRDRLPVLASLTDLLEEDQSLLLGHRVFSPAQERAIRRLAVALLQVEAVRTAALPDILATAVRALDLDIDTRLAQAIAQATSPPHVHLDEFLGLAATYAQELPPGLAASLSGFVSWVKAAQKPLEGGDVILDEAADVVLMTVHQAKGLEWPAVAVVNMEEGSFPSGQSVRLDEDPSAPLTAAGAAYTMASASTWVESAARVPVPVRSDHDALPAFPWSLAGRLGRLTGVDRTRQAIAALDSLTSVDVVDEQVFTPNPGLVEGRLAAPTLSLQEEYGSRNHADERRLAYVAITRSRGSDALRPGDVFRSGDVLVTFSAHLKAKDQRVKDGSAQLTDVDPQGAGIFWKDIADSLRTRPATVQVCPPVETAVETAVEQGARAADRAAATTAAVSAAGSVAPGVALATPAALVDAVTSAAAASAAAATAASSDSKGSPAWSEAVARQMTGLVCGPDAPAFLDFLCSQSRAVNVDELGSDLSARTFGKPTWPFELDPQLSDLLTGAADQVRQALQRPTGPAAEGRSAGQPGSLFAAARALVEAGRPASGLADLRSRVATILADSSLGVTALQALLSAEDRDRQAEQLLGIVRPIPRPPSPKASLGTRFHEWAQAYLAGEAGLADEVGLAEEVGLTDEAYLADETGPTGETGSTDGTGSTDEANLSGEAGRADELSRPVGDGAVRSSAIGQSVQSSADQAPAPAVTQLATWQARLRQSVWVGRSVFALERPYVIALGGQRLVAKIDAIFYGGLDGQATGPDGRPRFTIVDWKTGDRPVKQQDVQAKLIQLDLYRLALARNEGLDIGAIDACLYYVDVADPKRRQVAADSRRSEEQILHDIQPGLLQFLDTETDD